MSDSPRRQDSLPVTPAYARAASKAKDPSELAEETIWLRSVGTTKTSALETCWSLDLSATSVDWYLAKAAAHCARASESADADEARRGRRGLVLHSRLQWCTRRGDTKAAIAAALEFEKHMMDWAAKDRLERDAKRGIRNVETVKAAAAAKMQMAVEPESPGPIWLGEVESLTRRGLSAETAYCRIAQRHGVRPGTVKKAIIRLRRRLRRLSAR